VERNTCNETALAFGTIALEAAKAIMAHHPSSVSSWGKPDGSPVTQGDIDADCIIRSRLAALMPGVMVITEETCEAHQDTALPDRFILVDPLDGTREFKARRDEFTVNIALIEAGQPIVSALYAPALHRLYLGMREAYRVDVRPDQPLPRLDAMRKLTTNSPPAAGLRAVASRSHLDPSTQRWLDERRISELCPAGSSLKFCVIAEGDADVYPRFAPTMEWDTAAGHGILAAAGGTVLGLDGAPLRYGKPGAAFRNESFVAWGQQQSSLGHPEAVASVGS
jgi:3'(2'), 5'-bisphosphate nucleotidase